VGQLQPVRHGRHSINGKNRRDQISEPSEPAIAPTRACRRCNDTSHLSPAWLTLTARRCRPQTREIYRQMTEKSEIYPAIHTGRPNVRSQRQPSRLWSSPTCNVHWVTAWTGSSRGATRREAASCPPDLLAHETHEMRLAARYSSQTSQPSPSAEFPAAPMLSRTVSHNLRFISTPPWTTSTQK
jgi:hypothetical protein